MFHDAFIVVFAVSRFTPVEEFKGIYARVHVVGETYITQSAKVELVFFQQRSKKVIGCRTICNIGRGWMEER